MGRASRWLGIFLHWGKCSKDEKNNGGITVAGESKGRKSITFGGRAGKESSSVEQVQAEAEASWLTSLNTKSEREQNKHAIAVAVASVAAVDAAVVAAKAAASVVRLTSHGRVIMFSGRHEGLAAVRIQSFFRGYLARKALRALKALVQLQSLIRGFLVRKKTEVVVFRSGGAPVSAHSDGRRSPNFWQQRQRYLAMPRGSFEDVRSEKRPPFFSRQIPASFDSSNSSHERSPKIVEVDTFRPTMAHSPRIHRSSGKKCQCASSTVQGSPRFLKSSCTAPSTPVKLAPDEFRRLLSCPNYMASTRSFSAKVRSQSAPRQPEEAAARFTPVVVEAVRSSCSQIPEAVVLRGAAMKKLVERAPGDYKW